MIVYLQINAFPVCVDMLFLNWEQIEFLQGFVKSGFDISSDIIFIINATFPWFYQK